MKTKELIKRLQEIDPSGEIECCIMNMDIHFADLMPAYWDGTLEILKRDPDCKFYNIIGGKYTQNGQKIKIIPLSITDAISIDPALPVDYSELSKEKAKAYKESNDLTRKESQNIYQEVEFILFREWFDDHARMVSNDTSSAVAKDFFDKNISYKDRIPDDIPMKSEKDPEWNLSYKGRRFLQWSKQFCVSFDGFDFHIERRESK